MSTPDDGASSWSRLERQRATLFLVAGGLCAINAAIVATGIVVGSEQMTTLLGETFNAAGWAFALLGLLGVYSGLAGRTGVMARIGAGCAVIGVVVFTLLSGLSLAFYAEIISGDIQSLVPLILPGTILGAIVSFLVLGVATLRTDVHPRSLGYLLLALPLLVIASIIRGAVGLGSPVYLLGIVSGMALVMITIGFRLGSATDVERGAESTQKRVAD